MRRNCAFLAVVLTASLAAAAQTAPGASGTSISGLNNKDGLTYAWIPPGRFTMGCTQDEKPCQPDENPAHVVIISRGFWMSATLVTQGAYERVMHTNPSHFRTVTDYTYGIDPRYNKLPPDPNFNAARLPVEHVTWNDASTYCSRVGMRLPTEAEWEYAAKGGKQTGWYAPNTIWLGFRPAAVASLQPNAYGLYDMLGEMYEWVADWYGPYGPQTVANPQGPKQGQYRVLRSWPFLHPYKGLAFYVSSRSFLLPEIGNDWTSFRCAGNTWVK